MVTMDSNIASNITSGASNAVNTAFNPAPVDKNHARALAYLKEYVGQMRAAGFSDMSIKQKLIKTGSIFIPDNLPANFGKTGPWATGMLSEFRQAAIAHPAETVGKNIEQGVINYVPSPNEYLNYMPGGVANRLPTYSEYTGNDTSPFFNPSGKFSQTKLNNLGNAEANYIAGYKGKRIGVSADTLNAGVANLPLEQGQQFYQDFVSLAQQKADEAQKNTNYDNLVMNYPDIQFTPGASVEENAQKIHQYNVLIAQQKQQGDQQQNEIDVSVKAATSLVDDWSKAKSSVTPLFNPILGEDGKTEYDPLDLIINYIRQGESIGNIVNLINSNNIPITNYQLQGLYYLYGK